VERLWADASLITRLTGWVPDYGGHDGFRRGLEDTIAWFRRPENLSAYHADRYVL
jgi:dTDP-glucose 4,6-dehydratase